MCPPHLPRKHPLRNNQPRLLLRPFRRCGADHLRLKSNTAKLDEVVTAGDVLARLCTFKECFESIKDTLRPEERKEAIIYGSMGDLDREGKCWEVDTDRNSIHGSQVGYIDLNGKLVLIRNAPEG